MNVYSHPPTHSPDEFMFRQFRRHSTILTSIKRQDYFMLSAGANMFPMSKVWKGLIQLELEEDLVYHWYTSQEGFPLLQRSARFYEHFIASEGNLESNCFTDYEICMTLGASQAAAIVFDYIAYHFSKPKVLLLGYNYPLFERLAKYYDMQIGEIICHESNKTLPSPDLVECKISASRPTLLVITIPNNPSGEIYDTKELSEIINSANRFGTLVLIDKVGELPISSDPFVNIGKVVNELQSWHQVIIINSFSKSDSVPGFRVGYVLAAPEVIAHAATYQLRDIMNPSTFPILPIFFTFLTRCLFLADKEKWKFNDKDSLLKLFFQIFNVTTAIPPLSILKKIETLLSPESFAESYDSYTNDLLEKTNLIQFNKDYVLAALKHFITETSQLEAGFNFLIKLRPFEGKEEDKVCADLFEKTGLAILTKSAFCNTPCNQCPQENFWIRVSLASPQVQFHKAIDKFKSYLRNLTRSSICKK